MKNRARRPRIFNGLAWFFEPEVSRRVGQLTITRRWVENRAQIALML
jgi:hypothetical protein